MMQINVASAASTKTVRSAFGIVARPLSPRAPRSLRVAAVPKQTIATKSPPPPEESSATVPVAIAGLICNPICLFSEYLLATTGDGFPAGPGGAYGAAEGVSYLVIVGIAAWSIYTKVSTGKGLPAGPNGLLGAAEGISYLSIIAGIGAFGYILATKGSLPGPLGN